MSNRVGVSALVCGLIALACVDSSALAARYARQDTGCVGQLYVDEVGSDRYRTRGCGKQHIYQCDDERCWPEGYLAPIAADRAAREFGCERSSIEVRWIQEEVYRVEGCGQQATYECDYSKQCHPEGTQRDPVIVPIVVR